jgi:hypothetical protein
MTSVEDMTSYDELGTPAQMTADCRAASRNLRLESRLERAAGKVFEPAPSILFEDFPREVPKPRIRISEAAQRIANALELHLD